MKNPLLFVAFDDLREKYDETMLIMHKLSETGLEFNVKVNLDAILETNGKLLWEIFNRITLLGHPVFVDIKMWNGSRTMAAVAQRLVDFGIDYFNVWVQADDQLESVIRTTESYKTKVLGVTVLTHYGEDWCQMYFRRSLEETVIFLTQRARELGCHGVVLPGTCLPAVGNIDIIKVVPGIRMEEFKDNRHKQEVTPEFAAQNGADAVVCGSPIMKAPDKVAALHGVLSRLNVT
jgi:orotidine 5'-phosphate decarboxylase subfamily 1